MLRQFPKLLNARYVLPLSYILALAIAYSGDWSTKDLVWSFWLSSLCLGYLHILLILLKPVVARKGLRELGFSQLFLLAFFSVHFCAFHGGYALFFEGFFDDNPGQSALSQLFVANPFSVLGFALKEVLPSYWLFLIPVIARKALTADDSNISPIDLLDARRPKGSTQADSHADDAVAINTEAPAEHKDRQRSQKSTLAAMQQPYQSIIRLHFTIFALAIASAMQLDSFMTYAVILALFFFIPDLAFKKTKTKAKHR